MKTINKNNRQLSNAYKCSYNLFVDLNFYATRANQVHKNIIFINID